MTTTTTTEAPPINMADRIELRRFVGRELLLWLWFESEIFEATLRTKKHGSFGLWLEGRLILDEGKESTMIKGNAPGLHREAKESLLRGKTPSRAGLHLSFADKACVLTLRGDTLAFAGLVPPPKTDAKDEEPAIAIAPVRRKKRRTEESADMGEHESFYDRMHFAAEVEELITALYRDFLTLRLSPTWDKHVMPTIERWVEAETPSNLDARAYRSARDRALKN